MALLPSATQSERKAVFFDRDGTLIEHVPYITDPALVRILPGVCESLSRLKSAGYLAVVITNQPSVGKGLLTPAGLESIHREMRRQLSAAGAELDGIYFCTSVGTIADPAIIEFPDRKPGPGMLLRAASELAIDLSRSWMVGDSARDVFAGHNAGCRGMIFLPTPREAPPALWPPEIQVHVAADVPAATDIILSQKSA